MESALRHHSHGAIETMMIDVSYAAVGQYRDLPTHAYMGLSDSKQVDYQAGLESGLGSCWRPWRE